MDQSPQAQTIEQELNSLIYLKDIKEFTSFLEKGDLTMDRVISYAWVLYGMTRAGKTSAGHGLSGNPLQGIRIGGEFMVRPTTKRNLKHQIGNDHKSKTVIPNFFEIKSKNPKYAGKKCYLIDTPGYGDNYGVLRILANGYFHFRLYSKVQNMKFLLTFDIAHIKGTARQFFETIEQFTKSFDNYQENKQTFWKSCCFLFNKVDQSQFSLDHIKQKLLTIASKIELDSDQEIARKQKTLKQFIGYIVQNDRIFYIKRCKEKQTLDCTDILEKIDAKVSDWWSRDLDANVPNQVSMNGVKFSLAQDIIRSAATTPRSRLQYPELIKYYTLKIKEFVQRVTGDPNQSSISVVLKELVRDAMGSPSSSSSLEVMKKYINTNYPTYDPLYNQERIKIEKQLFQPITNASVNDSGNNKTSALDRVKNKNVIVKRFKALQKISQLMHEINDDPTEDNDQLKLLSNCQKTLYGIIRQFNKITTKKTQSPDIVYKFGYLIYRIISEVKVFRMLTNEAPRETLVRIREIANNQELLLYQPLKAFMGLSLSFQGRQISLDQIHEEFVKRFDLQSPIYKGVEINQGLIEFISRQSNKTNDQMNLKISILLLEYSSQILNDSSITIFVKNNLIKKLTHAREICMENHDLPQSDQKKKSYLHLIRKITKNLGDLLLDTSQFSLAREVYQSIQYVDSVCRVYQTEIDGFRNSKDKKDQDTKILFKLIIEYIKYMCNHFRFNDALKTAQKAYQIVDDDKNLQSIGQELTLLMMEIRKMDGQYEYETNIANNIHLKIFSPQLKNALFALAGPSAKSQEQTKISKSLQQSQFEDCQNQLFS